MLKQIIFVVLISASVYWGLNFVNWMGYFRKTFNHAPGPCHRVAPIEYGSEDMQVLPSGITLITSGFRSGNTEVYSKRPGRIYLFDFNKPNEVAEEVKISANSDFKLLSPHGLNIWTDPVTGTILVYVVSHQPTEIVDKFRFDESTRTLTHLKRITGDPNFHQLNDIAVVSEDQFYFTNYVYANLLLEMQLGLRWGSIGFFNGTGSSLLETGLFVPNGVILSRDHKYLYLAHCGDGNILVYSRRDDNSLSFNFALQIDSAVDNVNLDASTGDILVGSHPVMHKVDAYMDNPEKSSSPSHVLRIKMDETSRALGVEEIYSNDGTEISGSTVAVIHGRGMLIGSVVSHMLYCEIK